MVLLAVIAGCLAIGATQPKAVKKIGHGILCAVSFGHASSCHAPAPVAPPVVVK